MVSLLLRLWVGPISAFPPFLRLRSFRSDAALEAIARASEERVPNVVLYNYPSFSGAFSALFAHLFHTRLRLPCLILPFSSVAPLRFHPLSLNASLISPRTRRSDSVIVHLLNLRYLLFYRIEDLYVEGLERCYFLDFLGPKGFAAAVSRRATCE